MENSSSAEHPLDPAALLAEAEERLAAVNDALRRLDDGVYGRCARCGGSIADPVLAADPLATTCPACPAS